MKKLIIGALLASALITPATASASASGAESAVERELRYDYGWRYNPIADCQQRRRGYYTCELTILENKSSGAPTGRWDEGRARVWQYGNRYSVSYRIY